MKNIFTFLFLVLLIFSCTRVPVTNRKQLNLLPEDQLIGMSDSAYKAFLDTNIVLKDNDSRVVQVRRVGNRIKEKVEKYFADHKMMDRLKGFAWEFNVVQDKTINAWCMPGGKVVVYTGILGLCTDDTLLSVVMGHEISHALARHGNERMSQQMALYGLGQTLSVMMGTEASKGSQIFLQAYGIASALGSLKYSRQHETEADKLGLIFMYMAGYNPEKAILFWEKMSAQSGANVPEILSTHPSDETRIADITAFLPEIKKYAE
jgi:predicted Zn-dependent protease